MNIFYKFFKTFHNHPLTYRYFLVPLSRVLKPWICNIQILPLLDSVDVLRAIIASCTSLLAHHNDGLLSCLLRRYKEKQVTRIQMSTENEMQSCSLLSICESISRFTLRIYPLIGKVFLRPRPSLAVSVCQLNWQ